MRINVPIDIIDKPMADFVDNFSFRKIVLNNTATNILNFSIGNTILASPFLSALK